MTISKSVLIAWGAGALAVLLAIAMVFQAGKASQRIAQAQTEIAAFRQANADLTSQKKAADAAAAVAIDQANDFKARAEAAEGKWKVAQAKLAALPPTPPVTLPAAAPEGQQALADAFAAEGFPPTLAGPDLSWTMDYARGMYPLVKDGKQYPNALLKIGVLEEVNQNLAEAKDAQTRRADALEVAVTEARAAESAAEGIIANDEKIIIDKDKIIKSEQKGKVRWGLGGAVLGFLLKAALTFL